jgi:predicted permease
MMPFGSGRFYDIFFPNDRGDQGANNPAAAVSFVAPGFERALGISVLRGRAFTPSDDSMAPRVVMINESLAKRHFPGRDPIGQTITWNTEKDWRIIGVLRTAHLDSLSEEAMPILYTSMLQSPKRSRYFVVRADTPPDQFFAAARAVLHNVDPTIAITDASTMEQRIYASLGGQRFRAALMATLGALALALAVIGIYSVVAYSVTRRIREIGIRMALGEAAADVRRRVVIDALRVAAAGIAIGTPLAALTSRWLSAFLVGVSPYDLELFVAAAGILAVVVVGAAYGPARRAARVDPMTALRAD